MDTPVPPTLVELRVGTPARPTPVEPRVVIPTTIAPPVHIIPDDTPTTPSPSTDSTVLGTSSIIPLTKNTFVGKKVSLPGNRFSQRLKTLREKRESTFFHPSSSFKHQAAKRLLARHVFDSSSWHPFSPNAILTLTSSMAHIYDSTGKKLLIDKLLSGPDAHIWKQGVSNEMGRLTRGISCE